MFVYDDALKPEYGAPYVLKETYCILNPDKIPEVSAAIALKLGLGGVIDPNPNNSDVPLKVFNYIRGFMSSVDTTKGRMGASLATGLYKELGINLRGKNPLVADIGTEITNALWTYPAGLKLLFTQGAVGHPTDYLHTSSCWFVGDSYHYSRDWLRHNGGGALRLYLPQANGTDKLVCRVWHTPTPSGNMLLFNNYGAGYESLENLTGLVRGLLYPTLKSGLVGFTHDGHPAKEYVYLNSESAGFIGAVENIPKSVKFFWVKPTEHIYARWLYCRNSDCGHLFLDDDGDDDRCEDCR